jgi:phosphoadenosine phosphosulfate reductase
VKLTEEQIIAALQPGLFGGSCVDRAIEALRMYEPPEGYHLAFSGGKDSLTIKQLAVEAGVKFDAHYGVTTCDPPEVVQYIRQHHPDVIMHRPAKTMWELVATRSLPTRVHRFCCAELKENLGRGRFVITGVRAAESTRRKERARRLGGYVEVCRRDSSQRFIHPIIDWTDEQVWAFIRERQLPYCCLYDEGWHRIGCVVCPFERQVERSRARWPKLWAAMERASRRYYESHPKCALRWSSPEAMWEWWCDKDAPAVEPDDDPECIGLFSAGMEAS